MVKFPRQEERNDSREQELQEKGSNKKYPASGDEKENPPSPEEKRDEARKKKLASQPVKREDRSDWKAAYEHDRVEKNKFKLRVVYNRNSCIGSSHCILSDPYNFDLDDEMRAILKEGEETKTKGVFVKIVETDEPHLVINAAKTCTPKVISVIDLKTGKRIAP